MTEFAGQSIPPPPPPHGLAPLVGLYGIDQPTLDIYEDNATLFANGCGLVHEPTGATDSESVPSTGNKLILQQRDGRHVAVVNGETLVQQDFAAAAIAQFRRSVLPELHSLRTNSAAAEPPAEALRLFDSPLVEINAIDPGIAIDMRYATTNNFMGVALYECAVAFLQHAAATALARAQASLLARGCSLVVLDAYRPWSVTWLFWQAVPPESRQFLANPAAGSKHNRGCAVDVALADAATGDLIPMPSDFDEPTMRANPDYGGGTSRERWHRDLLRREMERAGFSVDPHEWWHYDFADWRSYPIRNESLAALAARARQ